MVTFICHRCGKFFQHKASFKKHLLKIDQCPPIVSKKDRKEILRYYNLDDDMRCKKEVEVVEEEKIKKIEKKEIDEVLGQSTMDGIVRIMDNGKLKFKCPYCNSLQSRKNNLMVHIKLYCKGNRDDKVLIKIDKDDLLKWKDEKVQIIYNTTNNMQQINQNILLQAYGKEEPIKFTDDFMSRVLRNPIKGIPDLISMHHFNPEKPENHNVRYNGKRSFFIDVFNGNFWEAKDKGEVIHDMIVSKKEMADDFFEEVIEGNKIKEKVKNNYNEFSEKIDRYVNAIINELNYGVELIQQDKELYKQLYKQVELMMINAQRILRLQSKSAPSVFQSIE